MTDDLTRPIETPPPADEVAAGAAAEPAPANGVATEPAGVPAGTEPVVTAAPDPNRLRWAVGLGVAGLAIAVAIAAFIILGSRPAPEALKYIPADAAMVVEIRPDLPGDQLQKLGNLLAHFPGFKDQSTLPDKLDESLSRLVGGATNGKVDYRADLKPWLSGPAFFALRPATGATVSDPSSLDRGVLSLSTTGTVSCDMPLRGLTVSHETYNGVDLAIGSDTFACVLLGRQALLGDRASVRAAIDAHSGGTGMDRSATYQKARAALEGDQLLTIYIDGKAYLSSYSSLLESMSGVPGMGSGFLPTMPPAFPEWVIEGFRAEDDALVIDAFTAGPIAPTAGASAPPSLLPIPAAHASVMTPLAPAGTLFFVEVQGAGVALQNAVTSLRSYPNLGPALQMLDGAGGAGKLVGWLEDFGVIVVNGTDGPTGGIMLAATDETTANQQVATLLGLVALAGLGNDNVVTTESTIGGVKVTTITINNIGALVPQGQLPPGMSIPPDAKVSFSIAAKGKVILLGTGESFMTAVLTVQPGAGLVDQDRYKRATARALPGSQMTMYLGLHDIVAFAETSLPADAKARWESELKPYFAPFEALSITAATSDGSSGHARFTLSVGNP
jgi:uncharacterized protein DUF3352